MTPGILRTVYGGINGGLAGLLVGSLAPGNPLAVWTAAALAGSLFSMLAVIGWKD